MNMSQIPHGHLSSDVLFYVAQTKLQGNLRCFFPAYPHELLHECSDVPTCDWDTLDAAGNDVSVSHWHNMCHSISSIHNHTCQRGLHTIQDSKCLCISNAPSQASILWSGATSKRLFLSISKAYKSDSSDAIKTCCRKCMHTPLPGSLHPNQTSSRNITHKNTAGM